MKILVIGSSGFLGGHVFQKLCSNRSDVSNVRNVSVIGTYGKNRPPIHTGVPSQSLVEVNLSSKPSVEQLMDQVHPDAILWCAKSRIDSEEQPLHRVGLHTILERMKPSTRLVFLSTDGVLPGKLGPYPETAQASRMSGSHRIASYTNAKIDAEHMVEEKAKNYCIVRSGPIFGRNVSGEWDARTLGLLAALAHGETVQRPDNLLRTFSEVEDLANAICELAGAAVTGILHVGNPVPESYYSYAVSCARAFGYPDERIESFSIPLDDAEARNVRLDTTMDTEKSVRSLGTRFRTVFQALSAYAR